MEKMRMMLVDDEERFLSTTQKLLAKKDIEAVTATSGKEGERLSLGRLDLHRARYCAI